MFSKKYLLRVIIGSMMQLTQQFSGINAINFYSIQIFNQATGDNETLSYWLSVSCSCLLLITSIIQGFVLNYYGRKTILKVGISALVIFHAILSTCFFIHDHNNAESLLILIIIFIFLFIISKKLSSLAHNLFVVVFSASGSEALLTESLPSRSTSKLFKAAA